MAGDMNTEATHPSSGNPEGSTPHFPPHPDPGHALPAPDRSLPGGVWVGLGLVALLLAVALAYGIIRRGHDEHRLEESTNASAVLSVNVTHPTVADTGSDVSLPGNTQAFDDTPIYARTSGYLKQWYVDIGQRVKKGQLMATIETPELDEQLQVAQANLKSAQADLALAKTTSERYQNLLKQDSVSKQETDVAVSGAAAKEAAVDASMATVRRLQQLVSFEKVYAPYSGVVTERNTDIGDLIDAGSPTTSGAAKELYRIASVDKLRVFVPVPEVYAPVIKNGSKAMLTLDEYPGKEFVGIVARNSNAIDMNSRTLNVEVDIDNPDGKLLPGAYVFAHFKIPQSERMLSIPSNTLLFRSEGLRVGLVRDGKVHLQPVVIGHDNGKNVDVALGVTANDLVILNPSDSLAEGAAVQVSNRPAVK
ncbi:RND family efflux transporter, MFP subunit [Bryocella elongata]|uniref:RND family efflux transporter, MFP subunit n=1 Tax=Bryocella elongata TaxID=863522 RepID=A0A1H6B4L9_9BACT|nr:efflux RND transporter periplasmic adaptor subunit [Bryocella elongata]SEG55315.1 RND family efflux transporter, MFP subunit [Bryocella elongata]